MSFLEHFKNQLKMKACQSWVY